MSSAALTMKHIHVPYLEIVHSWNNPCSRVQPCALVHVHANVLENHRSVTWHDKSSTVCAQFVQHKASFWNNALLACFLFSFTMTLKKHFLWKTQEPKRGRGRTKRKKVDGEVMDTTHKSNSPLIVVKSGEFIVELLHSVFSQVL